MNSIQNSVETADDDPLLNDIAETKGVKPNNCRRWLLLEPAVAFGILYMGGMSPLLQQYCYKRIGEEQNINSTDFNETACLEGLTVNNSMYIAEEKAQHETSIFLAKLSAVQLIPVLFSVITFGSISDKVGRKIGLVLPMCGACLAIGINVIIFWLNLPLNFLYLSKIVEGLFGGFALFLSSSFSYIADITTLSQRTFRIILLEIVIICGVVISSIGMGYLIKFLQFIIPCAILFGICLVNLIYIIFLPESYTKAVPISNFSLYCSFENPKKSIMLYIQNTESNRRWKLQVMAILLFLLVMCDIGRNDVVVLYTLSSPFCFTPVLIGYFSCCYYLISGIGSVSLTKLLQNRLPEMAFLIIGCISAGGSVTFLAFSTTRLLVFLSTLIGLCGRLTIGMIRAHNSKLMDSSEQGAMFASIAWLEASGYVAGSVLFDAVYSATLSILHGFVFLVVAAGYLLSIIIASGVLLAEKFEKKKINTMEITVSV